MITLVLTNRNRDLRIVKNNLDSLALQSVNQFELFFVDYGSSEIYLLELEELILQYPKIQLIVCPVSGQLWNKSRAINIVLKKCKTPYFFVGDVDMIFHPDFVNRLYELKNENKVTYFQVGFLTENETLLNKVFSEANISFTSEKEATGMTLYPTELLKKINGYDEFYHGWGAEDTDVHVRMRNLGVSVGFYNKEILLKHQWHPKTYRTHLSTDPYHFTLEQINHSYLKISETYKKVKVNNDDDWGLMPIQNDYSKLFSNSDFCFEISPEASKINAFIAQLTSFENKVISIIIKDMSFNEKIKQLLKRKIGMKHTCFLPMKSINDIILHQIIIHYRNLPYQYSYNEAEKNIQLKIYFPV